MKTIQTVEPAQALAAAFGLKGRVTVQLDDLIVPTTELGSLENSPYQQWMPLVGETTEAAPAALNEAFIGVSPGVGKILGVERVDLINDTAATQSCQMRLVDAAQLALLTTSGTGALLKGNADYLGPGAPARAESIVLRGFHTTLVGNGVSRICAAAGTMGTIVFPRGFFLNGRDPHGLAALLLWNLAAADPLTAVFYCTEYRPRT